MIFILVVHSFAELLRNNGKEVSSASFRLIVEEQEESVERKQRKRIEKATTDNDEQPLHDEHTTSKANETTAHLWAL